MNTIQSDSSDLLGVDPIGRLLVSFSVPAIIGMLVNALYNMVDRIFVGQGVGPLGIAGIVVGTPVSTVLIGTSMLIGIGANALFAIRLGEGRRHEVESIMGNAFTLLIALPAILAGLCLVFLDPLLVFLGASEAVLPYARDYLRIILWGAAFQSAGAGINHFIRSDGHPRTSMLTQLVGAALNTVLDPLFIFVFDMGVAGAAWATIISQAVSFTWVMVYFDSRFTKLRFRPANMVLRAPIVRATLAIGFAPFAMQLASGFLGVVMNRSLLTWGGDNAVSAMGLVTSILNLLIMPLIGLNGGGQPIMGYNYGARKFARVRRVFKLSTILGTIFMTTGFIAVQLFPAVFIRMFSRDEALVALGVRALRIATIMLPIVGFQTISSNLFQSIGKPLQGAVLSLSRQVLLLIPLVVLLPFLFGLDGVFFALPASDLISTLISIVFVKGELRRLSDIASAAPAG
jgi:putative MATE family efflux protein